ncbi:MAG: hypothetical protein QXF76_01330 [Candidatus Anstonellales archaeon]
MDSLEFLITFSLSVIIGVFLINTLTEKVYIKNFEDFNRLQLECEIYKKITTLDNNIAAKIKLESKLNETDGNIHLTLNSYSCQ